MTRRFIEPHEDPRTEGRRIMEWRHSSNRPRTHVYEVTNENRNGHIKSVTTQLLTRINFFLSTPAFMAHQSDRSSHCVYVLCIKPTNLTSHVGYSTFFSRDGYRVPTYLIMLLLVFDLVWVKEPKKFRVQTAVSVCSFSKLWSQNNLNNLFSRNHCKN